jgi:hypothetical protein
MFTALNNLRDNDLAIQAGLTQIPPVIVNPIPVDINLPKNVPTTTDIPGGAALERWKLTNALYVDFILARAELKEQMRKLLPIEIFNSLEIIGGPRKWANINPEDVFNYVLSENFAKLNSTHKIVFIGGINELGSTSIAEHQQLIQLLEKNEWEKVILVGGDFEHCQHSYTFFNNALEAKQWLKAQAFENRTILIKGSRGIQMEQVLED